MQEAVQKEFEKREMETISISQLRSNSKYKWFIKARIEIFPEQNQVWKLQMIIQRSGSDQTQLPSRSTDEYHSFQEQKPHSSISILTQATPSSLPCSSSQPANYGSLGFPTRVVMM